VINLNKSIYTSTLDILLKSLITVDLYVRLSELILPLVSLTVY
jgi:hypothetical protein